MNSYQLKQTARSRRNNAQKVQRPLLNFKDRRKSNSNDQMLVTTKLLVIMRVVMIMMTWMILLLIRKGQTDHPSITEVMRVTMNIARWS